MKPGLKKEKPSELQISEVYRIVSLIQRVNCSTFALVTETASEMGIKKTVLMQYIEDNPKLFDVTKATSKSAKGVVKSLGLAIRKVYLTPEENPDTEEWLEIQKKAWEKKIQVFEQTYYGQHEFWYLAVDDGKERRNLWRNTPEKIQTLDDERGRENLWRNTPEKIQTLIDAGAIKMEKSGYGGVSDIEKSGYGGFSDYYKWEGLLLTPDAAEAITKLGWELVYP